MDIVDFDQLYNTNQKRLHYIAFRYTKDWFLAEDIVQEAFLKAYKKINTVEEPNKLGPWLAIITTRTALDFLRSKKRKSLMLVDPIMMEPMLWTAIMGENIEDIVDVRLFQENIISSMEKLTKEYQQILFLKVQCGLKESEIASLLGLKSTTVKTRLYRARKQLKQVVVS